MPRFVYFWMLICLCMCYCSGHTYINIFAYILTCIFTYIHIFLLSVVGKGWNEGREWEKGRVDEERVGNGLLQSEWFFLILSIEDLQHKTQKTDISLSFEWFLFLLILPNFMIAKGLFNVNMKSLFCGEFCWVMIMMIKIKIIITLL